MTTASNYTDLIDTKITELRSLYPESIYEPIHYILHLPAKRIRPVLTLLATEMFGEINEASMNAALGVELFHNFTLMHDDIMDHASMRRGKDSVHVKWDINQAILSGDAMMVMAYDFIDQTNNSIVFRAFNRVAKEVCLGQQKDMEFESSWEVSGKEYLDMIKLKTAVLLGSALEIGAMLGGAGESDRERLCQFGIEMGLAFQIQDDFLDLFGNEDLVGKKSGGDIMARKKTILILKTVEECSDADRTLIFNMFNRDISPQDVEHIKAIMIKHDIPGKVEALKIQHMDNADLLLSQVGGKEAVKNELRQLAIGLINRAF